MMRGVGVFLGIVVLAIALGAGLDAARPTLLRLGIVARARAEGLTDVWLRDVAALLNSR